MARGTPKRANRQARDGAMFPSEVVARNVRDWRALRDIKQSELGERMAALGLGWNAGTAGFVERGDRAVSVDELVGLAMCLGISVGALLDPTGPAGVNKTALDVGAADVLAPGVAQLWARSTITARIDDSGTVSWEVIDTESEAEDLIARQELAKAEQLEPLPTRASGKKEKR